ncbi:MAG: hypothetical protein ACE5GO_08285, partial [Anaerolineales bacterium]
VVRFKAEGNDLIYTLAFATAGLSLVEAFIGALQLIRLQGGFVFSSLSAGDLVVGTLGTNSHLFATKMLFQGLFLVALWPQGRRMGVRRANLWLAGGLAAFAGAMLASALAATVLFFATVFGWQLWLRAKTVFARLQRGVSRFTVSARALGFSLASIFLVGLLVWLFVVTQQRNVTLTVYTLQRLAALDLSDRIRFQKIISFRESVDKVLLDNPKNALVGLGLGRYSSRAAMILSGGYLRVHPSYIPISRSPETDAYIYPVWNPETWSAFGGSIMGMPTNSIQGVLIEFGVVGTALLIGYFWTLGRRARARARKLSAGAGLQKALLSMVPMLILCLWMVSVTDLWLEYSSLVSFIYLIIVVGLSARPGEANLTA